MMLLFALLCAASPDEPIRKLYDTYRVPGGDGADIAPLLSKATKQLWDKAEAKAGDGVPPHRSFVLVVDGQDWDITALKLKVEHHDVVASFKNFGKPTLVRYKMVEEEGAWRIDDIIIVKRPSDTLKKLLKQ